ncbi:T9SS type A sorting domain-containing protein [Neolewinella lacunae]|uniref:T9SS type A sorting domain-containing protein n=1 Tax=Neolewinella lacunae TaxID=1517758 RepID=A0A923TBP9_9BACT|nr:T9SS type A sorting domain-containing protein [Neolewinella lacunae]MBC6992847.1 T9SS type A sorting domain-containing protein [Neolewinella lacunae]MDN3633789.1 T9SS type A sorting domain-containing protein [Neolewinella lacunae]
MRYLTTLLLGLAGLSPPLLAQFSGGPGDGFTQRRTIQLDLTGVPVGVRPLYLGGSDDGFARAGGAFSLTGQSLTVLYGGGRGDGFDRAGGSLTLGGQSLAILYGGGPGDGFDRSSNSLTLSGQTLAILYGGGPGDGFDRSSNSLTLGGQTLAILYGGGPGDGFDKQTFAGSLAGTMFMLYGGGPGDGFDRAIVAATLGGFNLADLYRGGAGDGFDYATYFGSIPLPLLLIRFEAFPEQDYVLIRWQTEDEVATDYFTIEKTRDGRDFAFVGETEAAGFSEPGERLDYQLKDHQPYPGTSFYRLMTTDLDGAISLSHLVEVQLSDARANWDFLLFPNPNTGSQVNVRPSGLEPGATVTLEIFDAAGKHLLQRTLTATGADHRFELQRKLSPGSYLIRMTDAAGIIKAKLLLVGR